MGVIIGLDKPLTNWDAEPFVRDEWIDNGHGDMNRIPTGLHIQSYSQWEFQEPKLEVPTICKAYFSGLNFREYPHNLKNGTDFLHFRILKFPLNRCFCRGNIMGTSWHFDPLLDFDQTPDIAGTDGAVSPKL